MMRVGDAGAEKMFSVKTLIVAALLPEPALVVESSSGRSTNGYDFDLSKKSDLTRLYNCKVYQAELMSRPLWNLPFNIGILSHSGVRVTLADGSQWLVHKGDGYGDSSQTVVVDTTHMSSRWKVIETTNFEGKKTVADFVADGGSDYHLLFDNCHDASSQMIG